MKSRNRSKVNHAQESLSPEPKPRTGGAGKNGVEAPADSLKAARPPNALRAPAAPEDPPTEWVWVTPTLAKQWLDDDNRRNRGVDQAHVERLSYDMEHGAFEVNGDTIRFSDRGVLIDGQHRLHAIIRSGKTIRMLVIGKLPSRAQYTIDRNRPRRDSDDLRIELGADAKYLKDRAAWPRVINLVVRNRSGKLARHEREEINRRHHEGIEWGAEQMPKSAVFKQAPVMGALVFAYPANREKVTAFLDALKSGAELTRTSPVFALREFLTVRLPQIRRNEREIALKTLRAVQAFLRSEALSRLEATEPPVDYFCAAHGIER
jgi:hypothetical protein